jgi:hypothetical protein
LIATLTIAFQQSNNHAATNSPPAFHFGRCVAMARLLPLVPRQPGEAMKTSASHESVLKGQAPATATLHELLRRIESEFEDMPGMCVTIPQAQRLWGLDATTCAFVLMTLVERRILRRTRRGTYVKC